MRVYHFLPAEWALDDLRRGRLKMSLLSEMNDPFELLAGDLRDKRARELARVWRDAVCKMAGAICFSDGWRDPLLWSHYADRHRGVALGFEVHRSLLTKMTYETGRLPDIFTRYAKGGDDAEFQKESGRLLATKYSRWEYESEYRFFPERKESDGGMYFCDFVPHLKLKSVHFGVRFHADRREFEGALRPKYQGTEIIQTRMAFKSFSIVRQKLKKKWMA